MKTTLTMRVPLDRPPTEQDHWELIGADDFNKLLMKEGWTDAENTVLKPFHIEHKGHIENGEYYIEWMARLKLPS